MATMSNSGEIIMDIEPRIEYEYVISISSFLGAIGAEHFYGKIYRHKNYIEGTRIRSFSGDLESHELTHPMSSKMARLMNKKDNVPAWGRYKKGDLTSRFDTEEEVISTGVQFLRQKYGDDITIKVRGFRLEDFKILPSDEKWSEHV